MFFYPHPHLRSLKKIKTQAGLGLWGRLDPLPNRATLRSTLACAAAPSTRRACCHLRRSAADGRGSALCAKAARALPALRSAPPRSRRLWSPFFSTGLTRGHRDEGTELPFPRRPVRNLPAGLRQRRGLGPLRAPLVQQRHPIAAACFGGNARGIPDRGRRGKRSLRGEEDGQNSLPDEPLHFHAG